MEICYNGVWGTVCDYGWDQVDAKVVCQQLGFDNKEAMAINQSHFGAGRGPILLENVTCNQSHSNLSQCVDLRKIGILSDCKHSAGVICTLMEETTSTKQEFSVPTIAASTTTTSESQATTYKSCDTTSTKLPIIGTMSTLVIIGAIAIVITVVVIVRRRIGQEENR